MRVLGFVALWWMLVLGAARAAPGAGTGVTTAADAEGVQRFYISGAEFHPLGVNYAHIHRAPPYQSFDMFDEGAYNQSDIDKDFAKIAAAGFNYVKLWLKGRDLDEGWKLSSPGVPDNYAEHIANTIEAARRHNLKVSLVGSFRRLQWLPKNYLPQDGPKTAAPSDNDLLLDLRLAKGLGDFYRDLLKKLIRKDARVLDDIFYIDVYSEARFNLAAPPFSTPDKAFAFDKARYALSDPKERQTLMDRATALWFGEVRAQIREVAPNLLVTAGGFLNVAFGNQGFDGGARREGAHAPVYFTLRPRALIDAGASMIDLHIYPSPGFSTRMSKALAANEVSRDVAKVVPLLVGEFGAAKLKFPGGLRDGVQELQAVERKLCGFGFSGLAIWTWNVEGDTWTLSDDPEYGAAIPKAAMCRPITH